ncbi:unnamed protein product [Porites lobata]|uniref:Uncharacterized protein n=1 Tax=Porites lobata TaxID=104759 RepID=A0ABN8PYZ1_9CNID|nr:unnamed protein product [Porites lobata]
MSHIIMKITNSSVGKIWVRLKVKLPISLSQKPGYLPSNVLRTIVLENKDSLERNIGAEIVTVNEVTWDSPTLTTERSTIKVVTVLPTTFQGSLQEYYTSFLPYVLGAFCLTAAFIVGFVFYRRSKLRGTRIQPETTSNKSEEELIILSSRKTSKSTRPRSASNDTKRTGSNQTDLKSLDDQLENLRRNKYRFSSESDLRELIQPNSKLCNDDETEDTSPGNALFLTKSRLRELTKVST